MIIKNTTFAITAGTARHEGEPRGCWWFRFEVGALDAGVVLHTTQTTCAINVGPWLVDLAMGLPWEGFSDAPHPVIPTCRRVAWGLWSVTWGLVGPRREYS